MYTAGSGLPLEGIAHSVLQPTVSGSRVGKPSDEEGRTGAVRASEAPLPTESPVS